MKMMPFVRFLPFLLLFISNPLWSAGFTSAENLDMLLGPRNVQKYWTFQDGEDGYELRAQWDSQGQAQSLEFKKKNSEISFSSLWQVLDWVGEGKDWMEIDEKAILQASLKQKLKDDRQISWLLHYDRDTFLLAQLVKQNIINISSINAFQESPQALQLKFDGNLDAFSEFTKVDGKCDRDDVCDLIHLDYPNLTLSIRKQRLEFSYLVPDKERIEFPTNFSALSIGDRQEMIEVWSAFLEHEFSVMLQAFINSNRGVFNWQSWHWLDWAKVGFISNAEIESVLKSGHLPSRIPVFKSKNVLMECDGNGSYWMKVFP